MVAVGGWPVKPNIPGADLAITSNEVCVCGFRVGGWSLGVKPSTSHKHTDKHRP